MCGENESPRLRPVSLCGSPPRVRGKPGNAGREHVCARITPACAGKTTCPMLDTQRTSDHPRVCGENPVFPAAPLDMRGSPPRVRGKLGAAGEIKQRIRITPACAGKTGPRHERRGRRTDHPRVCGENTTLKAGLSMCDGSPPRVRGKPQKERRRAAFRRITPACAGKTLRKWRISVVDPSPQPRSSLTSRRAGASIGSQRAPCAAPV